MQVRWPRVDDRGAPLMRLYLTVALIAFITALYAASGVLDRWLQSYPRIDQPGGE